MTSYPLNCWYVAATSDEIGPELVRREVLGRAVVLHRQSSGAVAAFDDRCPHRGYPLSKGRVVDDLVVCGYHGFCYDADGRCVSVPSQDNPPYGAQVRSYPVVEAPPFVWLWPGEARRAGQHRPPTVPWLSSAWPTSGGVRRVEANYLLIHDHYLDVTHITEMHPAETPPGLEQLPPIDDVRISEMSVSLSRDLPPTPLADWEAEATRLPRDRPYPRRYGGVFVSPAVVVESWAIDAGETQPYEMARIQAVTPESEHRTRMAWRLARNFAPERAAVGDHLQQVFAELVAEDMAVVEAVAANAGSGPRRRETRVNADAALLQARSVVTAMLRREAGLAAPGSRFARGGARRPSA